ncbi:hypothetical protein AAFC00_004382 [Neodothiora populina]
MIDTFSSEQHQHYRAQLQAIQVDMTLILRANPYNNVPLDDDAEEMEAEMEKITGGNLPHLTDEAAKRDYAALAGKRYHDYVQDINRAMEQRDADLTALKNRHDAALAELERSTSYKIHVAQREHIELASTVRSRLVTSVTKKRDKLLREKEQLDIADSSALFLHPNQFAMNIPGSPGGAVNVNPRKTRHMRHRVTDQDEALLERGGRKRKPAIDDDGNDSPVPSLLQLTNGNDSTNGAASPFRDARDKTLYAQFEAPVFSIDRLFTDKELAHASTIAQLATHQFFHQASNNSGLTNADPDNHQTNGHTSASVASLDASADAAQTLADLGDAAAAATTLPSASAAAATPPPSQLQAPEMERTVSYHVTRNATRANPLAALSEAAALTSTNSFTPHLVPITRTDKGAPTPPGVDQVAAESDFALMFREDDNPPPTSAPANGRDGDGHVDMDRKYPESNLRNLRDRYLERAVSTRTGNAPFRLPVVETGPAHINFLAGVPRLPGYGYADPASMRFHMPNGGVPSSTAAVGAPSLPIVNDNLAAALAGGEPMSRATSFAGSEAGTTNGNGPPVNPENGIGGAAMRRVRNRLI